jgi:glutathione synthase/RimK-type ligase-like ATP-grasp enzyme
MQVALVAGTDTEAFVAPPGAPDGWDPEAGIDASLREALADRGVTVHLPLWNDVDVDWRDFDLAVVRTVWDYVDDRDGFVAWAQRTASEVELLNPADVLRWNTHKSYLLELEERGAPVVPTAWLARGDRVRVDELCAARDWGEVVVKPAVAAGSDGVARVATGASARDAGQAHLDGLLAAGDVMVQPFRAAIADGELSLVTVEGRVTHAVRKRPAQGEYRVQGRFGGRYARETPTEDAVALAEWIVGATGTPLLFARVDLVAADDGTLELSELEATEPDLYLGLSEEGTTALADAIVRRALAVVEDGSRYDTRRDGP